MLTIELTKDQVKPISFLGSAACQQIMSETEARQKLDEVRHQFEYAAFTLHNDVIPHIEQATAILLEVDQGQGWKILGYESLHEMIKFELKPWLKLSVSQIYRKLNALRVRRKISQICNADAIPDNQLEALGKLPTEEWQDAWEEITTSCCGGKVTGKQVRNIVERRLQSRKSFNLNGSSPSEPSNLLRSDRNEGNISARYRRTFLKTSVPYQVNELVMIQCCTNNTTPEQLHYSGCWGVVRHVLETTAIVAVARNLVEYAFEDFCRIPNPSSTLLEACDHITLLWQIPNLPKSMQHLLETFYQRQLNLSQEDLDILTAIERLYRA